MVGWMVATSLAMAPAFLLAQDADRWTSTVRCCSSATASQGSPTRVPWYILHRPELWG